MLRVVLQTIALPTELPRRVSAQIRRSARTPLAFRDTCDRLHHCPRYTIVLSRRVLRKGRRITRELGGRELAVVAAEHVHAPPATHLHDRSLRDAGLERVARPGVAVAVLLVSVDAAL